MVRKEPIRDMKYARKGTNLAAAKQPHARRVRTTSLLRPAGTPAYESSVSQEQHCQSKIYNQL